MKWLLSFLFCLTASAQIQPRVMQDYLKVATVRSSSYTPTNEPAGSGTNIISWWRGDAYTTNAGTATLSDIAGVHGWNLTVAAGAASPVGSGSNTLIFDGVGAYLRNTSYTSSQPHEVVIVLKDTSGQGVFSEYFDAPTSTTARNEISKGTNTKWREYAGTVVAWANFAQTNAWVCLDAIYNSTLSQSFSNTVSGFAADIGAQNMSGFQVAANRGNSAFGKIEVAEIITYSATNNPTQRSNIYFYLKTYSPASSKLGLP